MTARPFLDFLREHRGGRTHDELSDALNDVVAAVASEGKAASLTLTIKVSPKGDGAVLVDDKVTTKLPEKAKSGSIFFVTPENNLVRADPRQQSLALREIGGGEQPRDIGPPASAAGALA